MEAEINQMSKKPSKSEQTEIITTETTPVSATTTPTLELDQTAYTIIQQSDGHWAVAKVKFNLEEDRVELETSDLKEHAIERLKITLARELF
jgi:ribosomal protein S6